MAVELRLSEIRRCLAQDLIRPTQLAVLPLQKLEPLLLVRGEPGSLPRIAFCSPHPEPQRFRGATNLAGDRGDRPPLGLLLRLMLLHQPDCPLLDLRRKPLPFCHAPILSRLGASGNPGAVHNRMAGIAKEERATRYTQKVAWPESRWNDEGFGVIA